MIIGKGGFGKVWVVTFNNQKQYYALKEMSKARLTNEYHFEEKCIIGAQ
jgi:serine/threonine protein kinase